MPVAPSAPEDRHHGASATIELQQCSSIMRWHCCSSVESACSMMHVAPNAPEDGLMPEFGAQGISQEAHVA